MASASSDTSARIAILESSLSRCRQGEIIVGSTVMAERAGCTWVTLRDRINTDPKFETSGDVRRGGNGVEWSFKAAPVIRRLLKPLYEQKRKAEKAVKAAGADRVIEPGSVGSVKEAREVLAFNREIRAAEIAERTLISAAQSEADFREYNQALQSAVMTSAQRADPTNQWTPEQRRAWDEATGDILLACESAAMKRIELRRGGVSKS